MSEVEFLQDQKDRCLKWLAMDSAQLPGTLTHEKAARLLEDTEDQLIDHLAIRLGTDGEFHAVYA